MNNTQKYDHSKLNQHIANLQNLMKRGDKVRDVTIRIFRM